MHDSSFFNPKDLRMPRVSYETLFFQWVRDGGKGEGEGGRKGAGGGGGGREIHAYWEGVR